MDELSLRPLAQEDVSIFMKWHEHAELSRRYGGRTGPETMMHLIRTDEHRSCLVAAEQEKIVGYIDIEKNPQERTAWIGLVVNPDYQAKGYGKRMLALFLESEFVDGLRDIRAGIEQDNLPSLRCFRSVGFQQMNESADEDGIVNFMYSLPSHPG